MIIGAMKCATSTLQKQLNLQPGIFMTTPKEPNFFSDDPVYQQGPEWYSSLYDNALENDLTGEASTHYTKLPTYPETLARIQDYCGESLKLIYIVRHPVDRLVSHYIHEWSQGSIGIDINQAINSHQELVDYSRYHYQIQPYIEAFGQSQVQLVFYEQLIQQPQEQLARCAEFIGYPTPPVWQEDASRENVSSQRVRKFPGYNVLINNPILASLRRNLIPKTVRNRVKKQLTMQSRPTLNQQSQTQLTEIFNQDLDKLGAMIGQSLTCDNFKHVATNGYYDWK